MGKKEKKRKKRKKSKINNPLDHALSFVELCLPMVTSG
jgi:hypothetical protein